MLETENYDKTEERYEREMLEKETKGRERSRS